MLRSLAGGAMYGETWGEGPPAVLVLHGWRRTHADFAASLGPAAPEGALPTLAPDLPGFGATPPPPAAWGSVDYARAVAAVVRAETERTPRSGAGPGGGVDDGSGLVVVGHSLGGRVAVRLAAAHPELVAALVVSGAPLVAPGGRRRPPPGFRLARLLHRTGLMDEAHMERARRRYGSSDYRAAEGVMRDTLVRLVNERYEDDLAALHCPVELLWGDDDGEAPPAVARAVAAAVPQARLTWCPGAGHLIPLTAAADLRAVTVRAMASRP